MLRIKGLTKRYRTGDLALKGIDLDVPDGQVMALIGPSGAGKSTVIRCINRLVEPTAGTITLNDTEITTLGSRELRRARRRMGMIFQEYALVERLTVMENVLSGRLGYVGFWQSFLRKFPQADIDEAFRLLARVGLDHMADKRADELSGGQRQRVGICRALIQNPELAAGRRADRLARSEDLAADHAADQGAVRRAQALGHHQHPRRHAGADVRRADRRPAARRDRL